jgi:FkbM family methyltransferase
MTKETPSAPQAQPSNNAAEGNVDKLVQQRFFPNQNSKGVFVDVGAARPDYLSVSAYYRTLGWRVIGIEPNPKFYEQHKSRGYEVYQFACGDHDEDNVNFNVVDSHGAKYENGEVSYESFSSLGLKDSYAKLCDKLDTKTIQVNLRRLSTLLQKDIPGAPRVDILSIDVEGWELEVLNGLDLSKHRPSVIIAENLFKEKKYENHLKQMGYILWRRIHPNDVYVDETFLKSTTSPFRFTLERLGYKLGLLGR